MPKRKSTEAETTSENITPEVPQEDQAVPEIDSEDERLDSITDNCDQVRRKIDAFISNGEMKIGQFQNAINVSSRSYLDFMRQRGRDKGSSSLTYINAARFFKKRELQGFKPPRKKVKEATTAEDKSKYDVSSVTLPGEENLEVPVYDTCDEVRRKIRNHMRDPMVTQAGFLRDIAKAAYPNGERKPSSKTMNDLLGKKGRMAGNTSGVFYAAYVFFEKLRVRDGKPKTQFREEMEEAWGMDGVDVEYGSHFGRLVQRK